MLKIAALGCRLVGLPVRSLKSIKFSFFLLTDDSAQKGLESRSLMVMDMGQHVVQDYAQPLTLHQIMVPGLEDRARTFPALSTAKQLSPGEHSSFPIFRVWKIGLAPSPPFPLPSSCPQVSTLLFLYLGFGR